MLRRVQGKLAVGTIADHTGRIQLFAPSQATPEFEAFCALSLGDWISVSGEIMTTNSAGAEETVTTNDLFYWPPGHNVRVLADAEIIMFSPQREHTLVIDHMIEMVKG